MILKKITHVHIYGEFSDTRISLLFVAISYVYLRNIPYNTDLNAHINLNILATNTIKAKIKSYYSPIICRHDFI